MKSALMHLSVAVVWTFLHGHATMGGFLVGAIASFLLLWALSGVLHCENYVRRVRALVSFAFRFVWSMVKSNFEMARLSLTPGIGKREGNFTTYDVNGLNHVEEVLLAQFINLTPGTTVADRTAEGYFILHSFPRIEEEVLRERIDRSLKERLLAFTR
ncbi:MAG: hypothetical protein GXX91_04235 [Verrucomicrobiaceae bacterium]|nr:hypothetical protein [Verrucomicrobiaceae bacterium]